MTLLAPALLAGLVGLGLPVLAHLLGREPPRPLRFAAMRFLPRVEPSVTHRRAIQDRLLLALRLALLALLVFVLAKPASHDPAGVSVVAEVHDAVLVIDGSRSMELTIADETALAAAVDAAHAVLDSLPAGTRVGLCTSDPGGPRIEPSADTAPVAAALDEWLERGAPRLGAWTLAEGVPLAAGWLRDLDGDRKRVIYAIGDATERGLGSLPRRAEGEAILLPIPARDPGDPRPEHVAIVAADWAPAPELDPRAVRISAILHRFPQAPAPAAETAREVGVALVVADHEVARTVVELPVDEDTPVEFTHTLLEDGAAVPAAVTLLDADNDALASDDTRYLWLSADEGVEVVVVNGDPSELRAHDEVFFLATAVGAAEDRRDLRLRSLAPDQLERTVHDQAQSALADVDVLVLANVRAPAPEVAATIERRVRAGMGLWVSVGDRVDPSAYNAALADLLPLPLREAIRVGTAPGRADAGVEGLAPADLSHPIFRGLGSELGLAGAQARRLFLLEPDSSQRARIALAFTNGAPALLTTEVGLGRVALLTTTIDRDWADLPLRPGFVPLVSGTLGYLGGVRNGAAGSRALVGDVRTLRSEAPVVVTLPGGRKTSVAPDETGTVAFRETFTPGHYRARVGDSSTVFTVDVDPVESATRVVTNAADEPAIAEEVEVAIAVPRWRWLVVLVALMLAAEALLRRTRR